MTTVNELIEVLKKLHPDTEVLVGVDGFAYDFHLTSRGLREDGAMCPPRKDGEDVVVLVGAT